MISAGKTDIGLVRKVNEDSLMCFDLGRERNNEGFEASLFIVADGMGGHNAGEVASSMAVHEILLYIKEKFAEGLISEYTHESSIFDIVRYAILNANDKIYKRSILNSECLGMGTTASMALILNDMLYIGHVGDSRIYLVRENEVSRLTEDHSLVAALVKSGTIKPEEANNHPQKNIITRALGTEYTTEVDTCKVELKNGDFVVLCTDGLSNMVEEEEIKEAVCKAPSIDAVCEELIENAKKRGGHDNITVIIINMNKGGDCNDR